MTQTRAEAVAFAVVSDDGGDTRMLVEDSGGAYRLPVVDVPTPEGPDTLDRWAPAAQGLTGSPVRVVAEVAPEPHANLVERGVHRVVWSHAPMRRATFGYEWIPVPDVVVGQEPATFGLLTEMARQALRPAALWGPAAKAALRWADDCLRAHGWSPAQWCLTRARHYSTLYRGGTDAGRVVLKLAAPFFNNDGDVMRALPVTAEVLPPAVLASGGPGNATLLRHADGEPLVREHDVDAWNDTLEAFNSYQQKMAEPAARTSLIPHMRVPAFRPLGEVDLDDLVAAAQPWTLSAAWDLIAHGASRLAPVLEEFDGYQLPATLDHGDFHGGNVLWRDDGRSVVLDWTDAGVRPPLLWLATATASHRGMRPSFEDATWRRIAAGWGLQNVDADRLRRTAFIAGCVHQARHYHWIAGELGPLAGALFASGVGIWLQEATRACSI